MSWTTVAVGLVGLSLAWYLSRRTRSTTTPLPPGPPGLPIIGNLFDWPTSKEWETFAQWARTYGDIVHANVGGTHIIMLNSYEAAMALLHRRGAIYSDRPSLYFATEMVGWKDATAMLREGPKLREQRRLVAQQIGSHALVEGYLSSLTEDTQVFLCRVLDSSTSDQLSHHVWRFSGALILDVTYGYKAEYEDDEVLRLHEIVLADVNKIGRPGAYLVDTFPLLDYLPSWFPGTDFKREAATMRRRAMKLVEKTYRRAQELSATESLRPSLVSNNLQSERLSEEQKEMMKWAASTLYIAGADTTAAAIYAFFLFMTLFPDVQARAQTEIDAVVGDERLPTVTDRPQLKYVDAVIKETLRFSMNTPQGLPHMSAEDDIYEGYLIPRNSIVIANIHMMSRDARTYKNPDVFDPSRFLGSNPEVDPWVYVIGFGRRICPGRFLADTSIFLVCSWILATLRVSKAVDGNGEEITPVVEYLSGITVRAKEFPCQIRSRSTKAEALLHEKVERQ